MGVYSDGIEIHKVRSTNPDFILMDEPSEGLAPLIVQEVGRVINRLKESGFSILLVEQNLSLALTAADYVYVMSKGLIVYEATPEDFKDNDDVKERYLGVASAQLD